MSHLITDLTSAEVSDVGPAGWSQFDSLLPSTFSTYPIAPPTVSRPCWSRLVELLPRLCLEKGCSKDHGVKERNVYFNEKFVARGL